MKKLLAIRCRGAAETAAFDIDAKVTHDCQLGQHQTKCVNTSIKWDLSRRFQPEADICPSSSAPAHSALKALKAITIDT
jgi:dUTPase